MDLMPDEIRAALPPLYSQENVEDPIVQVKYFNPCGAGTWLVTEFDGEDLMFGYAHITEGEFGYISLSELRSARLPFGLTIERDLHFAPKPLSQAKRENGLGD